MIHRARLGIAFAIACSVLAVGVSATQARSAAGDRPESWSAVVHEFASDVARADRTAATESIDRILAILRRAPSLTSTPGWQVVPHVHVTIDTLDHGVDSSRPRFVVSELADWLDQEIDWAALAGIVRKN